MPSNKVVLFLLAATGVGGALVLAANQAKASPAAQSGKTPKQTPKQTPPKTPPAPSSPAPNPAAPINIPSPMPNVPPITVRPTDAPDMARELALHLNALELALGGPKNAQGHQNATLTKAFQKAAGLTVDNKPGPATFVAMARRGVGTLPLVMYWPPKADQKTVIAYRTVLRAIASEAPKAVADQLRASADRERGQGGIVGPLAPDTGVANPLDPHTKPNAGAPPKANA